VCGGETILDCAVHVCDIQRRTVSEMNMHVQYAGPNPVAFDIANHWCEYGADYHTDTPHLLDYSLMPDEQQQASNLWVLCQRAGECQ
jgi:hypothetical protein